MHSYCMAKPSGEHVRVDRTAVCTAPMAWMKSRTLQLLAFDEKSTFDTSALFGEKKRASLYPPK